VVSATGGRKPLSRPPTRHEIPFSPLPLYRRPAAKPESRKGGSTPIRLSGPGHVVGDKAPDSRRLPFIDRYRHGWGGTIAFRQETEDVVGCFARLRGGPDDGAIVLAFPDEVRRIIYTTNAIESLNSAPFGSNHHIIDFQLS
jgi:hypothetical protein